MVVVMKLPWILNHNSDKHSMVCQPRLVALCHDKHAAGKIEILDWWIPHQSSSSCFSYTYDHMHISQDDHACHHDHAQKHAIASSLHRCMLHRCKESSIAAWAMTSKWIAVISICIFGLPQFQKALVVEWSAGFWHGVWAWVLSVLYCPIIV